MGNYVSIKSSPSELINVADRLRDHGISLTANVRAIKLDIVEHENRGDTFPSDKFTDGFVPKNYKKPVPGPVPGQDIPANEALMQGAEAVAARLQEVGEYVGKAMVNYDVTDLENAGDIVKHTATAKRV
ncbi:hypothetical protein ACWT_1464 [Actinoplanes sp. SE50]|uniref:hypothetical protein n=1 Tax=unclassified Actinoplanes TaxID=2626549 RepID=UPI00023EC3FA|nr:MULTISPECIES: hypothetical protein [unclassified Actinoplanes]AEV82482.1 hypothetical protein ACPL_1585 [Actinoplanes sp. SE50/110]ATO80879.1 hypothetical protein ACWT_1464 [Actinoplanes sp. SE50]SLL98286.1 hypothetical protein ACSP50_1512 [Actinoplanes sp. SE50/110]